MWKGQKEKVSHKHLIYTCFFNDVEVEEKTVMCVLEDQRHMYNNQEKKIHCLKSTSTWYTMERTTASTT